MAKTNPIGVRFDEEILEQIKKEQNLTSPQKVLNYLMENYRNCVSYTEKGITIFNPLNGAIIEDHPNPAKPKNIKVAGYEFPIIEVKGMKGMALVKQGSIPAPKIDLSEMEKQFQEELSKIKNKK